MAVITIPFDYTENTHPHVVPICIADVDSKGNPVHEGWVQFGLVPAFDGLLKIADRLLYDKYRASEIAEHAVHSLSRKHGDQLGDHPVNRVLNLAKWHALDLRAGGRRARVNMEVELFAETLDSLADQYDLVAHLENIDLIDKLEEQLGILGLDKVKELLPWMLQDSEGRVLTQQFGQKRNTLTQRFYRGMRKAALAAGITAE